MKRYFDHLHTLAAIKAEYMQLVKLFPGFASSSPQGRRAEIGGLALTATLTAAGPGLYHGGVGRAGRKACLPGRRPPTESPVQEEKGMEHG